MYKAWTSICIPAQTLQEWACESWYWHKLERQLIRPSLSPLLLLASSTHGTPQSIPRLDNGSAWPCALIEHCLFHWNMLLWLPLFLKQMDFNCSVPLVSPFKNMSRRVAFKTLWPLKVASTAGWHQWMRAQLLSPHHSDSTNFPEAEKDLASTLHVHKCSYLAHVLQNQHLGFETLSPDHIVLPLQAYFLCANALIPACKCNSKSLHGI